MKKPDPPDEMAVTLSGSSLTLDQIDQVARKKVPVQLSQSAINKLDESARVVADLVDSADPIYGVNTGLGIFSSTRIAPELARDISRNLILSHAVAVGSALPEDVVRAAMLIRANTLARGHSGVRPTVIHTLLDMLNKQVTPIVPSQGSLGSSGDLALLAHLVLVMANITGQDGIAQSGLASYQSEDLPGKEAMHAAGISRIDLGPKEGLALTNGATFSAALVALALIDANLLLEGTEIGAALTYEALLGVPDAFDARIHDARLHPGQIGVAARMRSYLHGSSLIGSADKIQDAYSLRCTPQIIGPSWEALEFAQALVTREINAVTDNPLLFGSEVVSGGNFHGQPIGLVADLMKIALTEVCNLSERRTYRLLTAHTNEGLPPMLIADPDKIGLHSGLMMLQYTAASLCLENQVLATPSSTHSLPTSAGQEDHNANAATAARHLYEIVSNIYTVIAIELICAAQALEIRLKQTPDLRPGDGTKHAFECVREVTNFVNTERPLAGDIQAVAALIKTQALRNAIQ